MKHLISRRNFLKAAGVTTAAAAMAVGAPAASACWTGEKSEVTILYTNDVHTYIDKQAPELTYAAIAALKQSYQNAGKRSCWWTPVTMCRARLTAPWTRALPSLS